MKNEKELLLAFWNHLATGEYATSVALFTPETVEREINKFLFQAEAVRKLDEEAQAEGFESAADREAKKQLAEAKRKAQEAAEAKAIADAQAEEERAALEAKIAADKEEQAKRDLEDAEKLAKEKAEAQARLVASRKVNAE